MESLSTLKGKVALVTGAASGLGQATAIALAEKGADLIILDLCREKLSVTAGSIRELGRQCFEIVGDLTDIAATKTAVNRTVAETERVDILVNCAGIPTRHKGPIEAIGESDFDRMFAVHVKGAFFITQAVVPYMKQQKFGRIINISSEFGQTGIPTRSEYCGAKAAQLGLTKAWAKELAPFGILVNAIAAGLFRTPLTLRGGEDAVRQEASENLLKRPGKPEELAASVCFLACPSGDYFVGQVLCPNGGNAIVGI